MTCTKEYDTIFYSNIKICFRGGCEPFEEKHRLQIHPYADHLVTQQKGRKQLIVEPRSNGPGTYALNYDTVKLNVQMVGDNEIKVDFSTTDREQYIISGNEYQYY